MIRTWTRRCGRARTPTAACASSAERDNGVVVRGARFVTLGPLSNEVVVAPTYVLADDEEEFAIWFACPINLPGIRQICRDPFTLRPQTADHPLSTRYDEQDVLMIFDDVLIPWERVFLMRQAEGGERALPFARDVVGGLCQHTADHRPARTDHRHRAP